MLFKYFKNVNFPNRYISPQKLFYYLNENYPDCIQKVGESSLGKPIYMFSKGSGKVSILAWSQMHGNESNATHAMLDLLVSLEQNPIQDFWDKISLDFIFMLNPDGSEQWTRRNAFEIDINRDFLKESSKEMQLLKKLAKLKPYDYGLNLHEQRTIFSTDYEHPATLSFLSPSQDVERTLTDNRKKSMAIIASIYRQLKTEIPHHIARYTDEFYPTSSGDNFMKAGIPVILFEGGHFEDDYKRGKTREFYTKALFYALQSMGDFRGATEGYQDYFEIPENKESHFDIIYRNVKLNTDFECVLDIAVQYKETYTLGNDEIDFVPYVMEVGDIGKKKGWKEIDCTGKTFVSENKYPKLDIPVNFKIL
ncbi:MAG: M14 family zinc carboxypeptidase [Flavobacteriaceae bacterium]|nr:M14 family zinc carboxypeptidase [Flavobacteriaceae bacterium]